MSVIGVGLQRKIKKPISEVFRRCYIKRMQTDGTFESDWQEISIDVKQWGSIKKSIDAERFNHIRFGGMNIKFNNNEGKYNDHTDQRSLWYDFATQQRTLVKVEAGIVNVTLGADGIYYRDESPGPLWDVTLWDDFESWDERPVVFRGMISGDISFSDSNEVNLSVAPLQEIFRLFPASNLDGYTSTGVTASEFIQMVRDQTDGAGSFVFRPFFDDTTTNWEIATTTRRYTDLNTSTAEDVINSTVWDVIEKLSEAENFVTYVSADGVFKFQSREANTSTVAFEFYGLGFENRDYGHTIKKIDSYGTRYTKYYSRVKVKFAEEDTTTSYSVREATLAVSGSNLPWIFGHRTLEIENVWIGDETSASQIADAIFDNVSSLKKEVQFTTSFIPRLDILDTVQLNYDPAIADPQSLWDNNNWGDTTPTTRSDDLIWDKSRGDAFYLFKEEMSLIAIDMNLDKLEVKFTARET